jgi:hypothetical protein
MKISTGLIVLLGWIVATISCFFLYSIAGFILLAVILGGPIFLFYKALNTRDYAYSPYARIGIALVMTGPVLFFLVASILWREIAAFGFLGLFALVLVTIFSRTHSANKHLFPGQFWPKF